MTLRIERRFVMSSDFRICVHWFDQNLNVKLMGDFDENSANKLISILEGNSHKNCLAFIQTKGLKHVLPSAREILHRYLKTQRNFCCQLIFPDANASQVAPAGSNCFRISSSLEETPGIVAQP